MAKLISGKKPGTELEKVDPNVIDVQATTLDIDERPHARMGWMIVIFGVLGFFLWAGLAPLDQGIPAPGTVMVSGNRQSVQNLVGGVIDQILVRDGDEVHSGQVLVRMNTTQARSQAETLRGQYYSQLAVAARLAAERDGSDQVVFPDTLVKVRNDPRASDGITLQTQLFESRRLALQSELDAIQQSIASLQAEIQGLRSIQQSRKEQAGYLREQLGGMRELAREGFVARNRLLELERTWSQLNGELAEATSGIVSAQRRIAELELRMIQRRQEYQREVRTHLTDVQREVASLHSRIQYADFELLHTEVRAPVDGIVVGLAVFTDGGVVQPGTHLMDLVPRDEPLMVEARVPVHLIDKVHPGLDVEMMFTAFNQRTTPHIPGEVKTVSADRLLDEQSGEPYYRVEAQVTPEGEKLLATNEIRPGMPVDVLVKTGERSMLNYLLRPIVDRARTSLVQE